ncbi:hypothetical protein SKAU_G00065370 [Synaphobranchus kaupii]|uniref:Uncharacterized protein n=1 Tax=Synaphobranchus kaupii TaxID=118154 RepID=A0A9Q1G6S3_SYNKA|nr:hypothetical protein SKAU_G00065370 [Synaphobranchus kaupii]
MSKYWQILSLALPLIPPAQLSLCHRSLGSLCSRLHWRSRSRQELTSFGYPLHWRLREIALALFCKL